MRGWIIGQAPGRTGESRRPLEGRSGEFLASLAGLGGYDEFSSLFRIENLLERWPGRNGRPNAKGDAFPDFAARYRAEQMRRRFEVGDRIVLLGLNVARVFDFRSRRSYGWPFLWRPLGLALAVVIPHPSGIVQFYNREENRAEVSRVLRELVADLRGERDG